MTVTFGSSVDIADSDGYLSDQFLLITVPHVTTVAQNVSVDLLYTACSASCIMCCCLQDVITRTFCSDDGSRLAISVHSLS